MSGHKKPGVLSNTCRNRRRSKAHKESWRAEQNSQFDSKSVQVLTFSLKAREPN